MVEWWYVNGYQDDFSFHVCVFKSLGKKILHFSMLDKEGYLCKEKLTSFDFTKEGEKLVYKFDNFLIKVKISKNLVTWPLEDLPGMYESDPNCKVEFIHDGVNKKLVGWYDNQMLPSVIGSGWNWYGFRVGRKSFMVYDLFGETSHGYIYSAGKVSSKKTLCKYYGGFGNNYPKYTKICIGEKNYMVKPVSYETKFSSTFPIPKYFEGKVQIFEEGNLVGEGFQEFVRSGVGYKICKLIAR